jgi:hypothetical protein
MKTEELLNALTADYASPGRSFKHLLIFYGAAGFLLASAIYLAVLGPRPDAVSSLSLWRFDLKFVYTALLATLAGRICFSTASPGQSAGRPEIALALMAPAVILLGVCFELVALPKELVLVRAIGSNSVKCLTWIPILSLAPLAIILLALRQGAPPSPAITGAAAGLLAASFAATLYAANCTDDSPLFVVSWYTPAILIVVLSGTLIGSRALRW